MKFLSTRTIILSVGIGVIVGIFGLLVTEKKLLNPLQFGKQKLQSGDITIFSTRLVFGANSTSFSARIYSYDIVKLKRKLESKQNMFVDISGSGDTRTVQEAVNAVRRYNKKRVTIYINAGTYIEKVHVPHNKPYITFEGAGLHHTIISWNDNQTLTNGSTIHTASVTVDGNYFIGRNLSFRNTAPIPLPGVKDGGQAVALLVKGDKCAFYGCGIYGYQDTLYDYSGRHLFRECHIEGAVDFIFGNARSLYERCTIHSIASKAGSITAQSRASKFNVTGFGFVNCSIVGTGQILLGRAWRPYARVVFASSFMDNIIDSAGWNDWGNSSADSSVYFGEFNNSGPGANMSGRVPYARSLSFEEALGCTQIDWIDGSEWVDDR